MSQNSRYFALGCIAVVAAAYAMTQTVENQYVFFAGYVVLQYVALATAWNIAGGYAGYINFGTAGFFGAGSYIAVAVAKAFAAPLLVQILCGAAVGGMMGFAVGYLSVRLRGIYYSIATIAVAVIVEAVVVNWNYVGGARGLSVMRPEAPFGFPNYTSWLFVVMACLAVGSVAIARGLEVSKIGRAFAAIRENEAAAESVGVPTLWVKCIATTISGALMAAAGTPYALYASYIDPTAAFNMNYSLSALVMALLGGTLSWPGPVIGALLLAVLQQVLTVTVSAELYLLILGLILIAGVIFVPGGLYGLMKTRRSAA